MLLWQHFSEKFFGDFLLLFEFERLLFDQVLQVVCVLFNHLEHQIDYVHFPLNGSHMNNKTMIVTSSKSTYLSPFSDLNIEYNWSKLGLISGCSLQQSLIMFTYSGGAAVLDTEGRSNGGGFLILFIISLKSRELA